MAIMTAAELARYTGATYSDADAAIWIAAAKEAAENYTRRQFCKGQYSQSHPVAGGCVIPLHAFPIDSTQPLTVTLNGEALDSARYSIDYCNGILIVSNCVGTVLITYTGGFADADIPENVKIACAMYVLGITSARDNAGNLVKNERLDGYSVTYEIAAGHGAGSMETVSPIACALLKPYRSREWWSQ